MKGLLVAGLAVLAWVGTASAQAPARLIAEPPAIAKSYILGPEDVVEVDVLGRQDFRTRARIRPDGLILLPLIGSVQAANRTPVQLSEDVAKQLASGGYFANPMVTVDVVSYASRYVIALGAVTSSGLVPVDRAYRVSEILARVGGVRDNAADYVVLTRSGGDETRLRISDLATGGDQQDPYVQPGDKLYAPPAEIVYLNGSVNAPGQIPLTYGMTLRTAIAKAGGVNANGSDRKVKVTRGGRVTPVGLDDRLQSGDIVFVGERLF